MLIACSSCHRQYDGEHLEVGERVRCHCGDLMTVPEPRTHIAKVHHCSACGGAIQPGAKSCQYCGGGISLEERNLGGSCPECFARLMKNASYCMECGIEIKPTKVQAKRLSTECPRCEGALIHRVVDQGEYTECGSCGGLWLEESFFKNIVEARDTSPLGKEHFDPSKLPERAVEEVRYLKCPTCATIMHRKNYAGCSGVIIDWCRGHGFWFDNHELGLILKFVAEGGMDKARRLELERAKTELRRTQEQARRNISSDQQMAGGYYRGGPHSGADTIIIDTIFEMIAAGVTALFGKFKK